MAFQQQCIGLSNMVENQFYCAVKTAMRRAGKLTALWCEADLQPATFGEAGVCTEFDEDTLLCGMQAAREAANNQMTSFEGSEIKGELLKSAAAFRFQDPHFLF